MRYSGLQLVFQEIPSEISLAVHITGCQLNCVGCHSKDTWNPDQGIELNGLFIQELLTRHKKYISCFIFMGGEWEPDQLINLLKIIRNQKIKTALYTGLDFDQVPDEIIKNLDYLKYGPYIKKLGGLKSEITNQRLINLKTFEVLNKYFMEESNDKAEQGST